MWGAAIIDIHVFGASGTPALIRSRITDFYFFRDLIQQPFSYWPNALATRLLAEDVLKSILRVENLEATLESFDLTPLLCSECQGLVWCSEWYCQGLVWCSEWYCQGQWSERQSGT